MTKTGLHVAVSLALAGAMIGGPDLAKASLSATPSSRVPSPLEACAPAGSPAWTQDQLMCLLNTGIRHGIRADAVARLRDLGGGTPEAPWPTMVLAFALDDDQAKRPLFEMAASGFARTRDGEGEVLARHNLRNIFYRRGEVAAAAEQVALAMRAAEASDHVRTRMRAAVLTAVHEMQTGGDVSAAHRALEQVEAVSEGAPIGLRRLVLSNLATARLYLGRLDDAIEAYERHQALPHDAEAAGAVSTVALNLLNVRLTKAEQRLRRGDHQRLVDQASDLLADITDGGSSSAAAVTHQMLADLLRHHRPDESAVHLDRCLALERALHRPAVRARCLWTRALLEARRDPVRADRASREALRALESNPDGPLLVFAWQARMRLAWLTMSEGDAEVTSLQALDAIEGLRSRQRDDSGRAALFSSWTRDYYYLTGRLLASSSPRVSQAFEVGERLRARVLLEQLERGGLATEAERDDRSPNLDFASIDMVRRALGPDEAMLWYAIAPWEDVYGDFGGGAWVLSITRDATRIHRLEVGLDLDRRIAALVGLLRDRQTSPMLWEPAALALGRSLMGDALAALPPSVRRLAIVTDGDLHRLPFDVLRTAPGRPRVGDAFETALVPSATLWLRLRQATAPRPPTQAALVLSDPELVRSTAHDDPKLPPLPGARREARTIGRLLGVDGEQMRAGAEASERFLKRASLDHYAVLHLAVHARADEAEPERSAVFLAPGDPSEDGRLQPAEIAQLDFKNRMVVLSACDSASGFVLAGEGPLSLARAFFAGNARAVVATRWPLRDDDAAAMMEAFYRALASGRGAAAALRQARVDAIAAGLPASAWAGIVLLGDDTVPPFPVASGTTRWGIGSVFIAGVAVLMAIAAARRTWGST